MVDNLEAAFKQVLLVQVFWKFLNIVVKNQ